MSVTYCFLYAGFLLGISAEKRDRETADSLPARGRGEAQESNGLHHLHDQCCCFQRSRRWATQPTNPRKNPASWWGNFRKFCPYLSCPEVSFIKLSGDFILKVYVRTKARLCVRVNFFRFIKPCVRQNLHKNPFINPIQGKIVRTFISTPSPPRNHHIWSLLRLLLRCITHLHIISMHIPIHVTRV